MIMTLITVTLKNILMTQTKMKTTLIKRIISRGLCWPCWWCWWRPPQSMCRDPDGSRCSGDAGLRQNEHPVFGDEFTNGYLDKLKSNQLWLPEILRSYTQIKATKHSKVHYVWMIFLWIFLLNMRHPYFLPLAKEKQDGVTHAFLPLAKEKQDGVTHAFLPLAKEKQDGVTHALLEIYWRCLFNIHCLFKFTRTSTIQWTINSLLQFIKIKQDGVSHAFLML